MRRAPFSCGRAGSQPLHLHRQRLQLPRHLQRQCIQLLLHLLDLGRERNPRPGRLGAGLRVRATGDGGRGRGLRVRLGVGLRARARGGLSGDLRVRVQKDSAVFLDDDMGSDYITYRHRDRRGW